MTFRIIEKAARSAPALLVGLGLSLGLSMGMCLPLNAAPPPQGERELCRTLVRSLDDGEALTVERCWSVRFMAEGTAMRVEGTQSRVTVDAPAALAPIARMEESRVEDGIFPLVLSADGLVNDGGRIAAGETLEEARVTAAAMIAQIEPDPASASSMRSFVAQVTAASAQYLGRIPRDLFFPIATGGPRTIPVALPDGTTGSVTISQSATTEPVSGLLAMAQRSITTEAGGTTRQSVETWVLGLAI